MISDEIKQKVRVELLRRERAYQHTAAAGVVLYDDTNYGEIHFGHSGYIPPGKHNSTVYDHRHIAGKNKNDAEDTVFNEVGWEIIYWLKQKIKPSEMYIYIVGPHDMCKQCKSLKFKFAMSFGIKPGNIKKEYAQKSN
jgi:hypothetical protein